jgi:YesN/AraC family two-component response regulator
LGDEELAASRIASFLKELQLDEGKEAFIQLGMMHHLGSIRHAILISGFNPYHLYQGAHLYQQLMELREEKDILQWFQSVVLQPYIKRISESQDGIQLLIENVVETIDREYASDISLEYCADLHGIHPRKLSIGFKQVTGLTYTDYLMRFRLDKAKELLLTTDDKINEIAKQVGYLPPYFIRVFKKNEGVTPGQYRERRKDS